MKKIIISLMMFMMVGVSNAQPSIQTVDGIISDGNTVTINGSNFGTKSPVAPLLWENFDAGIDGDGLSLNSPWEAYGPTHNINYFDLTYSSVGARTGALGLDNSAGQENAANIFFSPTDELYVSYWMYTSGLDKGTDNGTAAKYTRLNSDPNRYNGAGNTTIGASPIDAGSLLLSYWSADTYQSTGLYIDHPYEQWNHHSQYTRLSTAGVADGEVWFRVGSSQRGVDPIMNRASGRSFLMNTVWASLTLSNASIPATLYMDDLYIDNTQSRVVLANNAVLSQASVIEMQIPTAWGDGQIEFSVNSGSFSNEDIVHLFVVNSNGETNLVGEQVNIGTAVPIIQTVDGILSEGQTITINGSNFGTSGTPPMLWEQFNDGTDGTRVLGDDPNNSPWYVYSGFGNQMKEYTNNISYSGGMAVRSGSLDPHRADMYYKFLDENGDQTNSTTAYLSYYAYMDVNWDASFSQNQIKWPRITSRTSPGEGSYNGTGSNRMGSEISGGQYAAYDNGGNGQYPNSANGYDPTVVTDNNMRMPGPGNDTAIPLGEDGAGGYVDDQGSGNTYSWGIPEKQWFRVEWWIKHSSVVGAKDAEFWLKGGFSNRSTPFTDFPIASRIDDSGIAGGSDGSWLLDSLWVGMHTQDNAPSEALYYNYIDDIYLSKTQSRVVIGESAVYDDCDYLQNQIIETWADGVITATVNVSGRYSAGDPAWLYVINENNEVSAQSQITIGTIVPVITDISGTFDHGGTVTITGVGLGTKKENKKGTSGETWVYDDFESGNLGSTLSTVAPSPWTSITGNDAWNVPIYNSDVVKPNSNTSARSYYNYYESHGTNAANSGFGVADGTRTLNEIYVDTWMYADMGPIGPSGVSADPLGTDSANFKSIRMWKQGSEGLGGFYPVGVCYQNNFYWTNDGVGAGWENGNRATIAPKSDVYHKWVHLQFYYDRGTMKTYDTFGNGTLRVWLDGELKVSVDNWNGYNDPSELKGSGDVNEILFGQYLSLRAEVDLNCPVGQDPTKVYWDNSYVDISRNRVEISNNPVYGVSSIREIQYINYWSDNEVGITLNTGNLSGVNYIFLIDADGTVVEGGPITIGTFPTITRIPDVIESGISASIEGSNFQVTQGNGKVEFGNAASYAGSTTKTSQTITAWGDADIEITSVTTGFNQYDEIWVYVTDSDGAVSSGFKTSIGTQPNITSTNGGLFEATQSVTISGSGFGTKPTAAPMAWETHESGTFLSYWNTVNHLSIIDGSRHPNSLKTGTNNFQGSLNRKNGYFIGDNDITSESWFIQYWFKLDANWDWGEGAESVVGEDPQDANLANVKFFRLWNSSGAVLENFVMATQGYKAPNEADPGFIYNTEYTNTNEVGYWGLQSRFTIDEWHNFQFQYKENSALGVKDGQLKVWLDGVVQLDKTTLLTREDWSEYKRPFNVGFYNSWRDDQTDRDDFYIDDVYVDTTWARVEIGNNQSYDSCTHRETQIPTSWGPDEISFDVFTGSFLDGESAYLFVIGADGNVNPVGTQITINSVVVEEAPGPVADLQVIGN